MSLFGRDTSFFDLLDEQAECCVRAARALKAYVSEFPGRASSVEEIRKIEHEADGIRHKLANKIDSTFVTPLDKEDLHGLSNALDDVTDFIKAGVYHMHLYHLTTAPPQIEPLVQLLASANEEMAESVKGLRTVNGRETIEPTLVRIHDLEHKADDLYGVALAELFNSPGADPLTVIKCKDVIDHIENAVDKCQEMANRVESVVIKYA